ncbi:MAG: hypothetical protein GYB33_12980 [Gammaproteobacteria bacterium]|nr:hypothetical protein [Gammaproteobacteria bacterium]
MLVIAVSAHAQLDENCVINILNRTIQVSAGGGWSIPNIPSTQGAVRARATCSEEDGSTISGQSGYFTILNNGITQVGEIEFAGVDPIPSQLDFTPSTPILFDTIGATEQLEVTATYPDGSTADVTSSSMGTNYFSTNSAVVSVNAEGLITVRANGLALISARKDGVLAMRTVQVNTGGDLDGDGLPDDYETANGLNPNDEIDAIEDQDGDGLTALEEFNLGTNPRVADTDGDGINDGEEVVAGADGFITNPLLADSDGDGLSDGVEIAVGSDPNDSADTNLEAALVSLRSVPANVVMTFNGIDSEVSTQLSILGLLIDGSEVDLTETVTYSSDDVTVASFGLVKGEVFGGLPGDAVVSASIGSKSVDINVTVRAFEAVALSAVDIPGYANNVDISGDYAFVAAGAEGLQVVDVSDRTAPEVVAALDTDGTAIDIKVVGDFVYLADGEAGLKIINVADPLAPFLLGSLDTAGVTQDLAVQLNYAFLANGSAGIEVVDISDAASPSSVATLEGLGSVLGIAVEQELMAIVAGSSLIAIDISDPTSPIRLGSVNIGAVKDLALGNGYAHVAAYSQGYRVVDLSEPMLPRITGGDSSIAPRDVALTRNFAFYAEQLFPNVVAFINIFDPEAPVFQGTINLSPFGDYAGTGIALDASYAYITEESFVVSQDYKATGNTKLFIAQYRDINDNNGVPPTISITNPADGSVVVEGRKLVITADAEDDIAVASVSFFVNDNLVFTDTSSPYQAVITVPAPGEADLVLGASAIDLGGNVTFAADVSVEIQPDADGDGLGDDEEVNTWNTDPLDPDSDDDGLLDGVEIRLGTDPNDTDSDDDGIDDQTEVNNGTDPLNPDVTPPLVDSSTPDDGATDVPENSSISVVFNEPLQPKSITSQSLRIIPEGSTTPLAGSLQLVSGNTELLFVPANIMADFTLHTVSIAGVRDRAGNPIVAVERSFTTGNFVDTVRPSVVDISPTSNATDVALNSVIDVIMSEPIIPETVTENSFYVIDRSTNLRFEGVRSVADDKTSISFVPNSPFLVGRQYQVVLSTDIQDLFGLALNGTSRFFTTSFASDGTAPQVESASVVANMQNVPTNALLNVRFTEVISALYVNQIKLLDGNGAEVAVTRTLNNDKRTVSLDPVAMLEADSNYTFVIDGVRDLSGNLLPNPVSIDFVTGSESDTETGGISHWSFANNAVLPLNTRLEVKLSERIDPTSINTDANTGQATFVLYSNTQNRFIRGQGLLDSDRRNLRFEPAEALQWGHNYRLYVTYNTYLFDLAGNRINGTSFGFTASNIEDTVAPSVQQTSFADGTTDVAVNSNILFSVDEPLSDSCLDKVILSSGGVPVPAAVTLASDRRTLTVNPNEDLAISSEYELVLNGLCDYAGNSLSTTLLGFTTSSSSAADTAGPTVQSISPVSNATLVGVDTQIVITYSEPLSPFTRPPVYVNNGTVLVPGSYEIASNVLTFTPTEPLLGSTQYRTDADAYDLAGNFRNNGNYYFTTEELEDATAPVVQAIAPETNAVDVSPANNVVLTFSEAMATNTINNSNIVFYANGDIIIPSVFRAADGREVTLSATLPWNSVVSVVVTDRVTDLRGNSIAPYVSSFTTSVLNTDGVRPRVNRTLPANGSSGWLGLREIVMYIDEPLAADSVPAAFHIAENGALVDNQGTLEVLGDGRTVRFTKNTPFAEGALVQMYLSDLATDTANNPLNNFSAFFNMGTTSDGVGVRPTTQVHAPFWGETGVSLNPVLYILWSEPLDPASLTDSNVFLAKDYSGPRVPITIELNDQPGTIGYETVPGQIMIVTPQELLEPPAEPATNQIYYLRLQAGITDTDGDTLGFERAPYFYTGVDSEEDDRSPVVLALSPPDGETGVGTNPYFAVRYDEPVVNMVFDTETLVNPQFSESNQVLRYQRIGTLPADTEVTETLPPIGDQSGNAVAATSTTFTTSSGPDLANGSVVSVSITSSATDVPRNVTLVREFDEPIDPVSVNESGVYLYDTITGLRVPTTIDLSADGKRLTMVPVNSLPVGRGHNWYAFSLRDLSGNPMSAPSYFFVTGFEADNIAPQMEVATLFDGQTEVPTNVRLRARFDEPLSPLHLAGVELRNGVGEPVLANVSLSGDRRTISLVPTQLLRPASDYTLSIADIEDISGNVLAAPISIGFTTGASIDNLRGSVLNYSFANNADVPLNAVLEVELSERIDPTFVSTVNNVASLALYSNTQGRFIQGQGVLAADGRHLRFELEEALSAGHTYRLYVTYNVNLFDLAGNIINGNSRQFSVVDVTDNSAPQVELTSIADGAVDMAVNSRVLFRVDEPLSDSCLNDIVLTSGGVTVDISIALANDRRTLTVDPVTDLATSTAYSLELNGLCDYAGNTLTTTLLGFTTSSSSALDTAGPTLQTIDPGANSTNVSVDTTITITYSEPISVFTRPVVYANSTGVQVPGSYSVNVNELTFTPAEPLLGGTQYRTDADAYDLAGNFRNNGNYYFTTEALADATAPTVTAIAPESNAVDVSPASNVVLSFSEAMTPNSVSNSNILFYANGGIITPSVFRSADGREATLSANLPSNSVVSVVVTDRVTDLSGNPMAPFVSSFTTSALNTDGSRPRVSRALPVNGSSGWLGLREVVLYTDEPLDVASVEAAFHISENGELVDDQGTLEVLGDGRTVRFTKDEPFAEGALVQVFLSDRATDTALNPLNNYSAYFFMGTTSDGVGVRPTTVVHSPVWGATGVSLNPALQILWSEPLDPASLTDSTVFLAKEYDGPRVPVSIELNDQPGDIGYETVPGQIMTVVPQELLELPVEPATQQIYYLRLQAGITDTDGDTQGFERAPYFYTGLNSVEDDRAPVVIALSPPDAESDVGTNPHYAVRFDETISSLVYDDASLIGLQFSSNENNQVIRYQRTGTLPASSEVTETVPPTSDLSGNQVAETSTTFNTGTGPDLAGGVVVSISVAANATDVPRNPILVREFNEPVDPVSVTESGVYLYDTVDNARVPTTLMQSADGKRLTLVPVDTLTGGRQYYWYATSLRDLSGNSMPSNLYYFTTGFEEDSTGPLMESATLFNGQTSVPTNVRLNVRFNEPLSPLKLDGVQLLDDADEPVTVSVSTSSDRRTLTVVPTQLLQASTAYTLAIADLEDVSGNALAAAINIGFTTGSGVDNIRPSISRWSFVSNAALPLNGVLEVELNERIDPTSVSTVTNQATLALYSNTQGRLMQGSGVLAADGRHLRFAPGEALQADHSYRLYINYNTSLFDLAGNTVNGSSLAFTTVAGDDETAPAFVQATVADGQTGVPTNALLNVEFNEAISQTRLSGLVLEDSFNASVPVSMSFNSRANIVTLDPLSSLLIADVEDLAGNVLATPISLGLTTGASEDTTRGNISSWSFTADETLARDVVLQVTLDERVDPTTVDAARFYLLDEQAANAAVPGSIAVSADGLTLTFTPDELLKANGQYRLYVSYSYFFDLAGNLINRGNRRFFTGE